MPISTVCTVNPYLVKYIATVEIKRLISVAYQTHVIS